MRGYRRKKKERMSFDPHEDETAPSVDDAVENLRDALDDHEKHEKEVE